MGSMSSTSRFELPSFPTSKVDLVKRYRFYSDLAGFLRAVARLDDTFDSFITGSPFAEGRLIRARRDVSVKVYDARAGRFVRLQEITHALDEDERCADLEVALSYSYLNERYDRVPLEGDVFLVRASIELSLIHI